MGNPSFLKLFAPDSLTHDCAIIFSGAFYSPHRRTVYTLQTRTKIKHCFGDEILFKRNIQAFDENRYFTFFLFFPAGSTAGCYSFLFGFNACVPIQVISISLVFR